MATLTQVSDAIKAKLEGVAGIGQVHDYERFSKDIARLIELYQAGERLNGWWFRRERTVEEDLNNAEVRRVHVWRIRGFLGLDDADASEKTMQTLVEAIAAAFRTDRTLGGLVLDLKDMDQHFGASGIQVERVGAASFGGVLCHEASLTLLTETTEPSA